MTLTELLTKANIVKVEQLIGKNTAGRVGGLFQDLINYFNGKTNTWTTVTDPVDDIQNTVKEGDRWITGGMEKIRVNGVWELISFWKLDEAGNLYTDLNVYSKGGVAAYGAGPDVEGGATGYDRLDAWSAYTAEKSGWVLSALLGNDLNTRVSALEAGGTGGSTVAFGTAANGYIALTVNSVTNSLALSTHVHTRSQISDFPTSMPASDVYAWAKEANKPAYNFSEIGSKPTTLSGYGITDALLTSVYTAHAANNNAEKHLTAQQLTDLLALIGAPSTFWKLDVNGNLYTDKNVYSTLGISAYGTGTVGSGGVGASALYQLVDASITSPAVDHLLVFNGTHWQNRPKSYLLADYSLTTHVHTFASITSKPTTLSGYGITDALLSSAYTASDVLNKIKTVDGTGSGLDADLLEGKHGSYYFDYDERTLGDNLNFDALAYDFHNKSFIVSPVHSKNFTGQTNFPFDDYGQMITFGGLNTYFPFQLAVSENVTKLKIRSKYRPDNNTVMDSVWVDIYTSNNANRSDVNWAANTLSATTDITLNTLASSDKSVKNFIDKFNSMFDTDANSNIIAKKSLYSVGEISAYQSGAGVSGLKLMGDMNANGKNITGASTVQAGNAIIGNDPIGVIDYVSPGLYNADNDSVIAAYSVTEEVYIYGNGYMSIDNTGLTTVPKMSATEYKFGRYKFMEDTNGDLGIYNGTTKIATILKTRTNSNL